MTEPIKVFISYRRSDTRVESRYIYERLSGHFGAEHVFFDIDNIKPGVDFVQHLNDQVLRCNVLLAVVGSEWTGQGKLLRDDDFVRIEICAALKEGIPVVPVFAEGAEMPPEDAVPDSLRAFRRRQGLPVEFGRDLDNHIAALTRHAERLGREHSSRAAKIREAERAARAATRAAAQEEQRKAAAAKEAPSQRYRVLEKLLTDDHSETFLAESQGVHGYQRRVLIQRLLPHLTENSSFVNRWLHATRLAGFLNHVNIHASFDVGAGDSTYFCVYEYLDFQTLRDVLAYTLATKSVVASSLACHIGREVCRALEYAHAATREGRALHVVHGNVSPQNVYLTSDGRVVLSGFGMTDSVHRLEQGEPGILVGAYSYLAPEVAKGESATPRSDLFSLGVWMWELVAGRRLFLGDSDFETVRQVQRADVPPIQPSNQGYRGELDGVLSRLLTIDPRERFPDARAARLAMDDVLRRNGHYVSQDDIAVLITTYRAAQPRRAAAKRQSIIGSLIDAAMLEFTSIDAVAASEGRTAEHVSAEEWGEDDIFDP